MQKKVLKIATRKSPLALWQANHVRDQLMAVHDGLQAELVTIVTQGDKTLDVPLADIGGKGLFVKELEQSLLAGDADIAVHSMKDVPVDLSEDFVLAAICRREVATDAFVSPHYAALDYLPQGACIGTSSLRRGSQLLAKRPDLQILELRGNVQTRLSKLDNGDFDAIILATAGLIRLQLEKRIRMQIPPSIMLPAAGQGAIGIECRADDAQTIALLNCLNDEPTHICVSVERAFSRRLEGDCQAPIAAYAVLEEKKLWLRGLVASTDGQQVISGEIHGLATNDHSLGKILAKDLLGRGADKILSTLHAERGHISRPDSGE